MKMKKYNDCPKEYRRNYKKEAIDTLKVIGLTFALVAFFSWLLITF